MAARGNVTDPQDDQANECAQALLELAMSFNPAPKPPDVLPADRNPPISQSPSLVSPEVAPVHVPTKRPARNRLSSSPKRKRPVLSPPHNFKPNCVLKRKGVSRVQIYNELVTSIQLDHSYYYSGDGTDQQSPVVGAADENATVSQPSVSLLSAPKHDKLTSGYLQPQHQPDLFKSDDVNYENFNLLLKCLTNVEETYAEQKNHSNGKPKANGSSKKDGNANDLSASSEEGPNKRNSPLFSCKDCSKSFSKKRYLIKHTQRMHHSNATEQTGGGTCRHCEQYFPDLSSHTCPRPELANCEFCGLRLRKNVLEKHLVQEHGLERSASDDGGGSSTISGSEHDQVHSPSSESVCGICHVTLWAPTLQQHVFEHVSALPSPATACPLCPSTFREPRSLMQHVVVAHCVTPPPLPRRSSEDRAGCKHSMLQRFLRDSRSGGASGSATEGGEQCAACVGSLVTSMASSSSTPHSQNCSMSASNLLERTTTELIEAALQCASK